MNPFRDLLPALSTALALCLLSGHALAQSQPPMDQSQYPSLATSKEFQRWWWAFQQRAYPTGVIPDKAYFRAWQQIAALKAAKESERAQIAIGGSWTNIGPAPILTGTSFARSGAVVSISVDPQSVDHWLIGANSGGVWETRDAGLTWVPMTDSQASMATGAVAFAPSNTSVVYAGTGANQPTSLFGAGILKSADGGSTWQLLAAATFAGLSFRELRVEPGNANVIVAATNTDGLAGRIRGYPPYQPPSGIHKSLDGGLTWSLRLPGDATALEITANNFSQQYAGIGALFGNPGDGVYRSVDGGDSWSPINGPWTSFGSSVGRVGLALAPSDPNVLYVSIVAAFRGLANDGQLLGVWRTNNAWSSTPSWIAIPRPDSAQWWYTNRLSVDPSNPNILYAGGISLWKLTGSAWANLSGLFGDNHSLVWAGSRLVVGDDGGVWSTLDRGATWTSHNTNLTITQFYNGSLHPTNANFALGASQDNGTEKWTGTDTWQFIYTGDGGPSAIAAQHPDTYWEVSLQNLEIHRTQNAGTSFVAADSGIDKAGATFIAPLAKCPANDDVFVAGTNNVWRSNNFFVAPLPSWNSNGPEMGIEISAIAFAPSDGTCSTYGYGTVDGQLRLTVNGGATWVDVNASNSVPNRAITALAFDPTNANVLYVTLSGFDEGTPGQPGHVFKTSAALSGSPTWMNVSPPVNIPSNAIAIHPASPMLVYVGTDIGIWGSSDGGSTWTHMGAESGMPNVPVFDLKINGATNRVVAFTFGRGAFLFSTTPPGPPTGVAATAGNAQASVSFTPPINNGGSAITGYTVTSNPAGGVDSNAGTTTMTHTITALTNGIAYTFTVTATNGVGTGVPSTPSNSVIPATVPGPPLGITATAGNALASVSFAAPASNGGSAITGYTVTSTPAGGVDSSAGATTTTHTITGLSNGTPYTFTVTATNAMGPGTPSASSNTVTPNVGLPPILTGMTSRKVHGTAGTFDLPLASMPLNPTTEPRSGGAGGTHTIVFTFASAITSGGAAVTGGTASAGVPTFNGNEMIVPLGGVTNVQYVTVAVSSVTSADGGTGGSGSVRLGFLVGDVNQNRVVTVADLGLVNAQLAQLVTAANFLKDVNATGTLTVADKGITNVNLTKALPPP